VYIRLHCIATRTLYNVNFTKLTVALPVYLNSCCNTLFVTLQLNSKRSLIPSFNHLCANDLLFLFVVQLSTVVIIVVTIGVVAHRQRSTVPPQNYSLSDNIFEHT